MVSFKEISDLHNSFEIEGQCRDHRSSPSPRDAAGTGPAVFKTTLLQKNGISAIFFSEMLYWVFFHIFDVVLALWHIPSLQINASTTF